MIKATTAILLMLGMLFLTPTGLSNLSIVAGQAPIDGERRAETASGPARERNASHPGGGFAGLVQDDGSFIKGEIANGKLLIARPAPTIGSAAITSVDYDQSHRVGRLNLGLSSAGGERLFKWKMKSDKFYTISIIGLVPGQYVCDVVESGLSELYSSKVPLITGKAVTHLRPLSNAILDNWLVHADDQVWYDFNVGDNYQFELFISSPGQLVQWHYRSVTGWSKRATFPFSNRENFTVINDDKYSVLMTESLKFYLIGINKLIPIKTAAGISGNAANVRTFLVINRDKQESYIFTAAIGAGKIDPISSYHLKDRRLESMPLSPLLIETLGAALAAADQK